MTAKTKLIQALKDKLNYLSKDDIEFSVDIVLDYIKKELVEGNRVEIRNFGSFSIRKRKYPLQEGEYNIVYYRMSKNVRDNLKNEC